MDLNFGAWDEWRQHILLELKRLNTNLEKIESDIVSDRQKVWEAIIAIQTELKLKAGIYGAVGGVVTTIIGVLANKHL